MGYYNNSDIQPKRRSGNNTIQNINTSQGYYVGSASNITRLFILVIFLFSLVLTFMGYYYGKELGRIEQKIDSPRVVPCISGVKYEKVSKRA